VEASGSETVNRSAKRAYAARCSKRDRLRGVRGPPSCGPYSWDDPGGGPSRPHISGLQGALARPGGSKAEILAPGGPGQVEGIHPLGGTMGFNLGGTVNAGSRCRRRRSVRTARASSGRAGCRRPSHVHEPMLPAAGHDGGLGGAARPRRRGNLPHGSGAGRSGTASGGRSCSRPRAGWPRGIAGLGSPRRELRSRRCCRGGVRPDSETRSTPAAFARPASAGGGRRIVFVGPLRPAQGGWPRAARGGLRPPAGGDVTLDLVGTNGVDTPRVRARHGRRDRRGAPRSAGGAARTCSARPVARRVRASAGRPARGDGRRAWPVRRLRHPRGYKAVAAAGGGAGSCRPADAGRPSRAGRSGPAARETTGLPRAPSAAPGRARGTAFTTGTPSSVDVVAVVRTRPCVERRRSTLWRSAARPRPGAPLPGALARSARFRLEAEDAAARHAPQRLGHPG